MTVFPKLDRTRLPENLREVWDRSVERRGEAKFIAGMGHNPELFNWYSEAFYKKLFYGGKVERKYKELGRLRLSNVHGCRSCNQGNRLDAKDGGLPDEKIENIHDIDHAAFSPSERAVMQLADLMSMGADPGSVLENELYDALKPHFTPAEILEMAMTFAMLAGVARFIFAFDLAEKETYCRF